MKSTSRDRYRNAVRSFVNLQKFKLPHSVTLTLKQSVVTHQKQLIIHHRIDRDKAVRNFRHFTNLLNRRVYGHSFKRHGKRVQVIPVLEGGGLTRFHYHCVIDCPRPELVEEFPNLVKKCWTQTDYGYDQIDIQPGSNTGWVNYMTKYRTKSEFDQSIDWINLHQD